jgi:hypothetical protein
VIPGWKVKRELDRFTQQISALFGVLWEPWVQYWYDRNRAAQIKVESGKMAQRDRVAIFLLFQPKGLQNSTLMTCRILNDAGYSVLAISNTPLADADRDRLLEVCWRVMERPNYGYDFGGYRDGILYLLEQSEMPERLLVMNDSIWFPLSAQDTLLERLERSGLDVAGSIVHHDFNKNVFGRSSRRVIESYLFLFSSRALRSPAFASFWREYRVSSNKFNAVYRGERRVADAMMSAGLTADGLFCREDFLAAISAQSDEFLRKTLLYASCNDIELAEASDRLLNEAESSGDWRDRVLKHIAVATKKRNFHGAFIYATSNLMDLQVLKKGGGTFLRRNYSTLYSGMRKKYLEAVAAGDVVRPGDDVLIELAAAMQHPVPPRKS